MKPCPIKVAGPLFEYLREVYSETSRTKLKQWLKVGAVSVNGRKVTRHDHALQPGDTVRVQRHSPDPVERIKTSLAFRIVYEDSAVVVIDKPAGLLTMGTEEDKVNTAYYQLTEYVRTKHPKGKARVFIVHRLDRDASGLIIFAKTEEAKYFLQTNWHQAEKKYYAVVEGLPAKPFGTIESYLTEDKFRRVYSTHKSQQAKLAITHYRVLKSMPPYALLEVLLETGRKNQIRVHLADLGHPIIGDKKYGSRYDPIKRLGLHAYSLMMTHPLSGEKMTFTSPLPPAFEKAGMRPI